MCRLLLTDTLTFFTTSTGSPHLPRLQPGSPPQTGWALSPTAGAFGRDPDSFWWAQQPSTSLAGALYIGWIQHLACTHYEELSSNTETPVAKPHPQLSFQGDALSPDPVWWKTLVTPSGNLRNDLSPQCLCQDFPSEIRWHTQTPHFALQAA